MARGWHSVRMPTTTHGPGEYFAAHPVAFDASLVGAFGTSVYTAWWAARTTGWRRAAFAALALSTAAEGVGILVARNRARAAAAPDEARPPG